MLSTTVKSGLVVLLLGFNLLALTQGRVHPLVERAKAEEDFLYDVFPADFKWGYATASYQIEGAYNEDGKGPNIWDTFTHQNVSPIFDGSNGDVACDSYRKYKEDVQLLKNQKADYYRFSISWSRVIPTGRIADGVNAKGLQYYNNLINELIANGIEPVVTQYHWDLPQGLGDVGGWTNETVVAHFGDYARLLYGNFGDRVKRWITFNEPWVFCVQGYGDGQHAPGRTEDAGVEPYQCVHNMLKSHATSYRLYESEFKAVQKGAIGISPDTVWFEPEDDQNPSHVEAAERTNLFKHGWICFPIFFGKYPDVMRNYIDYKSALEGRPESRLPTFDDYWTNKIKGSVDFLGLNHYTTNLVYPEVSSSQIWFGDKDTVTYQLEEWPDSASSWLKVVPWGFRRQLNWIRTTYGNPDVYITENGFSDTTLEGLDDDGRIDYYRSYINQMLKAVVLDGCNIKAYTAWSLLDNFEWARGYSERFGVHFVDYNSPNRTRMPKKSAATLRQIFADNGFPAPKKM